MIKQDLKARFADSETKRNIAKLKMTLQLGHALKKWSKQMKNSRQRNNILKEWISTQKSYIQDLKTIETSIQKPLKDSKLITAQEERILFPNLKSMVQLSQNLLLCIQGAVFGWHPHSTLIGENLKAYYKFFMIYRQYCNNFMKGQQIIKELKKVPQALKIQEKLRLDFESYIIKPVQRPPKYQLLLRQYLKALPKTHKDYKSIEQAIEKYHEVNELNNQSMDRQIRVQAMIKLQKLYGGIISNKSGRQYLREFECTWNQTSCRLHVFNDMILLLRKQTEKTDQMLKKILLDQKSYVHQKIHLKYFKNLVLVCGSTQTIHLQFATAADSSFFSEYLQKTIAKLKQKEADRRSRFSENQTKKKNMNKFKVSKWHQDLYYKVIYNAKFEITIDETAKHNSEAFYYVKFQIIKPYKLNQTLIITQQKMCEVQKMLRQKYSNINIPKLNQKAESMGLYDAMKNKTQMIEYRSFIYQEFLNFIFRNENFHTSWKHIAQVLGINQFFFDFASSENLNCKCNLCMQTKSDGTFSYYADKIKALKKNKKIVKSHLVWSHQHNGRQTFLNTDGELMLFKDVCSMNYFQLLENIRCSPLTLKTNYFQKMLALEAQMGKINYSLLEIEKQIPYQRPISHKMDFVSGQVEYKPTSLRIYLLSAQEEFIQIHLNQDRYVREIIQQIGAKNSLQNVFDWGLYLMVSQELIQISQDEKLLSFIEKWKVQFQVQKNQSSIHEEVSWVIKKLNGIKSLTEFLFGGQKGVLIFKKSMYFEPALQIEWCIQNKERFNFIISELYGRLKLQDLKLSHSLIVQMSSFYLLQKDFERVKYYSFENFNIDRLKYILPRNYNPLLNDTTFKSEVYQKIIANYDQINRLHTQRNAIQLIYIKIMEKIRSSPQWVTRNFYLTTYKCSQKHDVIVKITTKTLSIVRNLHMQKILQVDIKLLKYRVTTFSLFIQYNDQEFRFDGLPVLDIKKLIQNYRIYRNLSQNEQ